MGRAGLVFSLPGQAWPGLVFPEWPEKSEPVQTSMAFVPHYAKFFHLFVLLYA